MNDSDLIKLRLIILTAPRFHLLSSSDIEFQLSRNDISDSDFSVFCTLIANFCDFSRSHGSSASNAVSWIGSTSKFEHALVLFHPIVESKSVLNQCQKCWFDHRRCSPWRPDSNNPLLLPWSSLDSNFSVFTSIFSIFHKKDDFLKSGQNKELTASSFFVSNKKFTFSIVLIVNHGWKFLNLIKDFKPQITIKEAIRAWP